MTFYSQHTIEQYLDQYFPETVGHFLEIGCWNGELISQTFYLESERVILKFIHYEDLPEKYQKHYMELE